MKHILKVILATVMSLGLMNLPGSVVFIHMMESHGSSISTSKVTGLLDAWLYCNLMSLISFPLFLFINSVIYLIYTIFYKQSFRVTLYLLLLLFAFALAISVKGFDRLIAYFQIMTFLYLYVWILPIVYISRRAARKKMEAKEDMINSENNACVQNSAC